MASTLTVTKQLETDRWVVTAQLQPGATIPTEIFLYENLGTTTLGEYLGVITAVDLPRIIIWDGATIVNPFGNKYLRHNVATLYVDLDTNVDAVILALKTNVQRFSTTFQASQNTTTTYTIT